jgi:tetratricopeptide (TPR) repeat protein/predicted Ser/Thr protein kinase
MSDGVHEVGRFEAKSDRLRLAEDLLLEHLQQRLEGNAALDEEFLAAHPELMPELGEMLRYAPRVTNADQPAEHIATQDLDDKSAFSLEEVPPTMLCDLIPNQVISHYRIVARLGKGGMGEVFRAEDVRLGRYVALKLLARRDAQDEQWLKRFQREVRLLASLNHPHICAVYDVGEHEGRPFFVMELVEGRTLRSLTREQPPISTVRQIGAQISKALAAAHAAGVVHRDIKPENIMLRADGDVKVLDFGLARQSTGPDADADSSGATFETGTGMLLGTARYMSPEQAQSQPLDSASDLFSLGVVLYELTTGTHPFAAESTVGYLSGIVSQTPVSPSRHRPDVPRDLDSLILSLLEKDPRARPTADEARTVLAAVDPLLAQRAVSVGTAHDRHLVGRQQEFAQLQAAYERAASGRGSIICISGEPGIGKTTLVEEWLGSFASSQTPLCIGRGRCSERLEGTEAYLPLLEALDSLLQHDDRASFAGALKAVAPTWYVQLVPLSLSDSSAERVREDVRVASQERMKRELASLLGEASRSRPVVLFLDDLQWADVASIEVLTYLASRLDEMGVLILVTLRPTELLLNKHPFLRVKMDLQSRGVCHELQLDFLGREDIERYLVLEFPDHRFPAAFIELIHKKTEGSPLFMVDLVRHLRDRQMIVQLNSHWELAQSIAEVEDELPESVKSMIDRKLDQLENTDRQLLAAASVQGYQFDAAVVAGALEIEPLEVEDRLEALDRVHALVRRLGEREFADTTLTSRYRFVHALYQAALHSSLNPVKRAALSRAVGQTLVRMHREETKRIAGEVAFLFQAARSFDQAADHFLQAAENAAAVYANDEALKLLRRCVDCAEKLKHDERHRRVLKAHMLEGQLLESKSSFDEASNAYAAAEEAACKIGDKEAQVMAICARANNSLQTKRLDEMRAEAIRAMELAREAGSQAGVAIAQMALGGERMCVGELDEADGLYDRALPVLTALPGERPPAPAMWGMCYQALLHVWRLDYEKARQNWRYVLDNRETAPSFLHLFKQFSEVIALGNEGQLSHALQVGQEGTRLAELNSDQYWLPRYPNMMGWVFREMQNLETALKLDSDNIAIARQVAQLEPEANARVNLGHDYLALGEPALAAEHLLEAERIFDQDVWFRWRYRIRLEAEWATYWIQQEDLKKAAARADACLARARKARDPKYTAWAHKLLADIAVLEERMHDANHQYETALTTLSARQCPIIHWKILKAAGNFAEQLRDTERRDICFGQARAIVIHLAKSIHDERQRQTLLTSEAVRELRI